MGNPSLELIAKVREYEKEGYSLEEAIKKAVIHCRDHDILKEFLEKNSSEVLNMLMTEWNLDDAKQVWYEDGLRTARKKLPGTPWRRAYQLNLCKKLPGLILIQ